METVKVDLKYNPYISKTENMFNGNLHESIAWLRNIHHQFFKIGY